MAATRMKTTPSMALATPRRPAIARRALLATGTAVIAAGLFTLGGCGFKLRGAHDIAFKTVQLTGFSSTSPFAVELARALEASGVDVVDSTLQAAQAASSATVPASHVVIEGLVDKRDMVVSTMTAYGQVRDMTVRNTLRFRVLRADGSVLLPPSDVALAREMTYNERDALAKQDETEALHRAMQSDLVGQVLRRLAAIRPEQLATPPAPAMPPASSAAPSADPLAPAPR